MIELFLQGGEERMEQMRRGLAESALSEVENGAHALKSSAAYVGAHEVSELVARMEAMAASGQFEGIPELYEKLTEVYEQTRIELEELLP